ncbi:MAG: VOC family protein [Pseudomonadota bacterium]
MSGHGTIHWNELNARDAAATCAWYRDVLGWTIEEMPMEGAPPDAAPYRVASVNGRMVAGIFQMEGPQFDGLPDHWATYFAVDDVDASAKAAVAAGGTLRGEPFDVPGVGRFAMVQDAQGAFMGLVTPG